ncbi:hypothetical protein RGQ29_030744 [Quercus rubra]|uniref:Uncharacterized protein n=1 Tax=Quercus rubra TaxID=3512 RepID=A0AAN7EJ74_QUERU|nr:hypothetical protein RGQ29_030744 [Quercus rubra]
MVKHNNVIPNGHFKKHWQNYVKTWFNQPARKERRRIGGRRLSNLPRPTTGKLRPIVHGQTLKYNMKVFPRSMHSPLGLQLIIAEGIVSLEGLQANVQRLKTFKAKLVVFPRRVGKFKVQGPYLPIVREKPSVELVKITEEMKSFKAYDKLRLERMNVRHVGARQKKAAEAEKDEKK